MNTLLRSVVNDRFYLIYVLAVYGGFREGELLGIQVEDLQLDKGVINVNHAVQYQLGNGVVITEPKNQKSRRSVKLPLFALTVLKDYLKQFNRNQGLLFTIASGRPVNPRFLIKHLREAIGKAELPDIRFHDLRHTSATLLLSANVHPKYTLHSKTHLTPWKQWSL